ncbi:MAG TPA: methyltransferase domain-containing protein [Acidimicrobiales bacterium]
MSDHGNQFGAYYYSHDCGVPYERNDHWMSFFGEIADAIVDRLHPTTVLDAGCAMGFLVEALRERGVEAYGVDISEYAISQVHESVREYCSVHSLADPLPGRYDLITSVEVIEHIPADLTDKVVANLCQATDRLLLSSSPMDYAEPTHVNVQQPEEWSAALAHEGFLRDLDHDASYLTPWAALYVRTDEPLEATIRRYDRAWWRLRWEVTEARRSLLEIQERLEDQTGTPRSGMADELAAAQEEILRLRDLVIGKDAELGTALGKVAELEEHLKRYTSVADKLDATLNSKSWKIMWAAGAPVRMLRRGRQEG